MQFWIFTILLGLSASCGDLETSEVTHESSGADATIQGQNGTDGETGPSGPQGPQGDPGENVILVDQNETEIGFYLERVDFNANTFEIMTIEGYRTVMDLDNASFTPPSDLGGGLGFSCMYESADCSGNCFGVEELAKGYILVGQSGSLHTVESNVSSQAITSNSHNKSATASTCTVQTIALTNAVPTQAYSGVLTQTLSAPIYLRIKTN